METTICIKDCGHHHGKAMKEWSKFTDYLRANPDQRFWQALRNWSGCNALLRYDGDMNEVSLALEKLGCQDTFYL